MSNLLEKLFRERNVLYYTSSDLKVLLDKSENSRQALIKRAIASGILIHVKRGLYCVSHTIVNRKPHPFELAQHIYALSAISLESALSYHGLIPEAVYVTTSVTTQRNKKFTTPLGEYDFLKTPTVNFLVDVKRVNVNGTVFFIANPWRALSDYVYCYKKSWKNLNALENDLRILADDLPNLTPELVYSLIKYYNSKRVDKFLSKILKETSK